MLGVLANVKIWITAFFDASQMSSHALASFRVLVCMDLISLACVAVDVPRSPSTKSDDSIAFFIVPIL